MTTMTQMLGQMMWLPASLVARWMDLFAAMMRAQPCCQGREAMDWSGMAPGTGFPERGISGDNSSAREDGATKEGKEEKKMSNCCCDNENGMVKLAEYTIVSIKRCEERILYKGEIVYADDMDDEAFATWVVALYLQRRTRTFRRTICRSPATRPRSSSASITTPSMSGRARRKTAARTGKSTSCAGSKRRSAV